MTKDEENVTVVSSINDLLDVVSDLRGNWLFRGQQSDWPISSSLERAVLEANLDRTDGFSVEQFLIREFRRRYKGNDLQMVNHDHMYTLSVMQHYGAPTRLVDFSYSPYIAIYFALEPPISNLLTNLADLPAAPVVWAINKEWCMNTVRALAGTALQAREFTHQSSNDLVEALYWTTPGKKFVCPENPFHLNERLILQQGVFLSPGDVNCSYMENLLAMPDVFENQNSRKISLKFSNLDRLEALETLHRMNIDRATMFPGLDGFAKSLRYRIYSFGKNILTR